MKNIYISTSLLKQLIPYLKSFDISKSDLIKKSGLEDNEFHFNTFMEYKRYHVIQNMAMELVEDPDFPIHLGEYFSLEYWSILGYILSNSYDINDLFLRLKKYSTVLGNYVIINLSKSGRYAKVDFSINRDAEYRCSTCLITTMVSLMKMLKDTTKEPMELTSINFALPEPKDILEYKRVFKCPLNFNMHEFSFTFNSDSLFKPIDHSDIELLKLFETHADSILKERSSRYSDRVEDLICSSPSIREVDIKIVAKSMGINVRTLQSRLKEEGESYKSILSNLRNRRSKLLINRGCSIKEVTYELGFSEVSSFTRFFKSKNGITPVAYKNCNR